MLGGSGPQGPGVPNISKMISMCWMNLPFGRNLPAYIKFVVSKSFAITSLEIKNDIKPACFRIQKARPEGNGTGFL
jgi:hypothetical protein